MEFNINYNLAAKLAAEKGFISTSMLQRTLLIGYSKASRIIDKLAENGIISEAEGNAQRKFIQP